jgi:Ca2+-binding EF-hand superfamily protein
MPTEEEVKEVLDRADNDKSGAVSIDELKDVIRIWYTMCKAKPKKGGVFASCCVM